MTVEQTTSQVRVVSFNTFQSAHCVQYDELVHLSYAYPHAEQLLPDK